MIVNNNRMEECLKVIVERFLDLFYIAMLTEYAVRCACLSLQFILLCVALILHSITGPLLCFHFYIEWPDLRWWYMLHAPAIQILLCSLSAAANNTLSISFGAHKLFTHFIYHFIKLWTFFFKQVYCVYFTLVILFCAHSLFCTFHHFCHLTDMLLSDSVVRSEWAIAKYDDQKGKTCLTDVFSVLAFDIFHSPRHFYHRIRKVLILQWVAKKEWSMHIVC